jgi:hypothetical protein
MRNRLRRLRADRPRCAVPLYPRIRDSPFPATRSSRSASPCNLPQGKRTESELPKIWQFCQGVGSVQAIARISPEKEERPGRAIARPLTSAIVFVLSCPRRDSRKPVRLWVYSHGAAGFKQYRIVLEQALQGRFIRTRKKVPYSTTACYIVGHMPRAPHIPYPTDSRYQTLPHTSSLPVFAHCVPNFAESKRCSSTNVGTAANIRVKSHI